MHISRTVVRNSRNFAHLDVRLREGVTGIVGERNTGGTIPNPSDSLGHGLAQNKKLFAKFINDQDFHKRDREHLLREVYSEIREYTVESAA